MDEEARCTLHGHFHQAFLSYRRQDGEDLACHIVEALAARRIDVFWDQRCLGPGQYANRLSRFDERTPVFLALVTAEYVTERIDDGDHDFCRLEVRTALSHHRAIIPLMKASTKDACLNALRALPPSDPLSGLLAANFCIVGTATFSQDMDGLATWIRATASGFSGEIEDDRCFINTFPDFDELPLDQVQYLSTHIHARVDLAIHSLLDEIRPKVGRLTEASVAEHNARDFSLYTGVGGLALALWAAAGYLARTEADAGLAEDCLADSHRALTCALELAAESEDSSVPAFYCGQTGIHALATMIHGVKTPSIAVQHTQHVVDALSRALRDQETELLYGRAGYLYSLLIVRRHTVPARRPPELEEALGVVFDSLESDGATLGTSLAGHRPHDPLARSPLAYRFPATSKGDVYFGAAHGLAGVLYVMIHLPERCLRPGTRERIMGALDFLVSIQTADGNFPAALGDPPEAPLVHWCHGAPGVIPTLCKAYEVFGEQRYLDAARRAAECVWSRGLLRKGLGVCHGIAGSALSLLTLFRITGSQRYLYRALRMCEATWSERCIGAIEKTPDQQRYRAGVPDFPYSLMEGKAGLLYAYVSLQRPDQSSFPGYDGAT